MIPVAHIVIAHKTRIADVLAISWEILSAVLRSFLLFFFAKVLEQEKRSFCLTRSHPNPVGMHLQSLIRQLTQSGALLRLILIRLEIEDLILLIRKSHLQV